MKRHFSFFLSAIILASACVSCADSDAAAGKDAAAETAGTVSAVTESVETLRPQHGVPVDTLDFGGEAFQVLSYQAHNQQYYFFADAETGDVMNDAIYERRRNIEDALNVSMEHELLATLVDATDMLRTTVMSGEDVYDQVLLHCIHGIAVSASSGYLYNMDDLPYLNLDAEWWNKEQMDNLRLGKNTYYGVNDYMIPYPYVMYFNRELVRSLALDDPYQMVQDGTWTLDVFAKMVRAATADLNGDGKLEWEHDRFGMSGSEVSKYISFLPASEQAITDRDENNRVRLAMNTEKTQDIITVFADLYRENTAYFPNSESYSDQLTMDTGRILFYMNGPDFMEKLRDCTVDFGFVPYPKWDAAQEEYHSLDFGCILCIPATITNPDLVGAVNELLAWESGQNVVPTYYNILLGSKFAQDETAAKMLNLIFDSICYEPGGNYFGFSNGFQNLFYAISNVSFKNGSTDFASFYAKHEKNAIKTIEEFYEDLDTIEADS